MHLLLSLPLALLSLLSTAPAQKNTFVSTLSDPLDTRITYPPVTSATGGCTTYITVPRMTYSDGTMRIYVGYRTTTSYLHCAGCDLVWVQKVPALEEEGGIPPHVEGPGPWNPAEIHYVSGFNFRVERMAGGPRRLLGKVMIGVRGCGYDVECFRFSNSSCRIRAAMQHLSIGYILWESR